MSIITLMRKMIMKIRKNQDPVKYARAIGVSVGKNCRLLSANFGTEPYLISLGSHVSISGGVEFITHEGGHWVLVGLDEAYRASFGYGRIVVKDNVYIGANVTILRSVTIGENTIVGAGALVTKSLEPNSVYAGVPARRICSLEDWKEKFLSEMPDYDMDNYRRNKKEEILKIVDKIPMK